MDMDFYLIKKNSMDTEILLLKYLSKRIAARDVAWELGTDLLDTQEILERCLIARDATELIEKQTLVDIVDWALKELESLKKK